MSVSRIAVVLVLLALASAGCQRRSNIVVIPEDSTKVVSRDSAAIELRETQQQWEAGGDLESAAGATSRLVQRELASRSSAEWRGRASYLLDSLGIGAEFAESNGVLAINYFSRSDPEGGSWPYLYWTGKEGVTSQVLDGRNLHLQSLLARSIAGSNPKDTVRVAAALFFRRSPVGPQPLAMAWSMPPRGGKWRFVQSLGPDSLGGYGTAEFEAVSDTGSMLSARAYRTPKGFIECMTCPHAYTVARFRVTPQGFARVETRQIPSPYTTFAEFIAALVRGDALGASERVAEPTLVMTAQGLGWNAAKGGAWRPAPGSDESPLDMKFLRGQNDAYVVHFRQQGDGWVITGWESVGRSVE